MKFEGNKKKRLIIEFFLIVFTIVGMFLLVGGFGFSAYLKTQQKLQTNIEISSTTPTIISNTQKDTETTKKTESTIEQNVEEHKKLNIVVYGVDINELLTDVIFVVGFDTKTKNINILSLPRDTRVKIPDNRVQEIKNRGSYVPRDGYVKLNEVHSYAGKSQGVEYATKQIEELLDITIDNYVKVNLTGFRNIVDALGGIEMTVPEAMSYEDPEQNLYIHLNAGKQKLDGKKAEQLVRYRSYAQGDLKRIKVQQLFMKALLDKVLNMENLIKKAPQLAYNMIKYVTTDIGIDEVLDYIGYIDDIKTENITMNVLPGEAQTINGGSFFIHDSSQTKTLVEQLFQ